MPLSFGVPLGLTIAVVGAILIFTTKHKKISWLVLGIGLTITLMTLILIVLAINSDM